MLVLAETQANEAWAQFATIFTNLGLNNYYYMDKLHD